MTKHLHHQNKCHVCGCEHSRTEYVNEVLNIGGKYYLVEQIPAKVCSNCGEEVFSRETTEKIRLMLHGENSPVRSISLDVFSYDEAV